MFDVGFTELVLLFVIGLLILGPERLPRVAAQLGRWMGKARRTAHQLRMQLEREMTMNDIMRNQDSRDSKSTAAQQSSQSRDENELDDKDGDEYPETEDANDSGHHDAGADDPDTPEDSLTDDGDAQQRSA